ncbi:bifunctional hydroxymethylpyrimidine kinase/phosphomethylpyrimidine kinase [Salinibius halmophilus]|uniref:bifunctional hydroxymethylpyrimidine kinase/phosphomethylpyrimidine kinase n=1 Tax=Salinibius halmophilus TaxID=1853216 RepID=UPI000E66B177|nr:bifunctional hydroxymethylpyrimidine kinase/phosphomethylpyrimidine kinase [Salinibius halmophilus]
MTIPIVLSIAGSDSGGGAGIQADIKSISANGGYAATVLSALTAQNSHGVAGIEPISAEFVDQQLTAVLSDLTVKAIKVGMLGDPEVIRVVAKHIKAANVEHVVVDPVMVSANGDVLLPSSSVQTLKEALFPLASVLTPNTHEAALLINTDSQTLLAQPDKFIDQFSGWPPIVLKGVGGREVNHHDDWLIEQGACTVVAGRKVNSHNTHGTGCSHSAAIATYLALGFDLLGACQQAKRYVSQALQASDQLTIGSGKGPIHHFFKQ